MSRAKHETRNDGFTLVEILIVAPVIIITITIFIGVIVTMTGDVLRTKGSTDIVHETQVALAQIEDDARLSTEFVASSYITNSPQGIVTGNYDTGGAAISTTGSPAKLIIRVLTTTQNPSLTTRALVYASSNSCGTLTDIPYAADIVYFLKTNADSTQSLWRRVVFGTAASAGTGCPTPWQLPSCSPGYTNLTYCKADDAKLLDDVSTMGVEYYTAAALDSGAASSATTSSTMVAAKITLATTNTVAGRTSTNSSALFAKRGNSPL